MDETSFLLCSEKEQDKAIAALTSALPALRDLLGMNQSELAKIAGISRQTYSAIETKKRKMTWSTFLSLSMIFVSDIKTVKAFQDLGGIFGSISKSIAENSNAANYPLPLFSGSNNDAIRMIRSLDDKGLHALETVIMLEYARCTKQPGELLVKSFNGINFSLNNSMNQVAALDALKRIRSGNND